MIFLPYTNAVILLEPYCGTVTEPGLPVIREEIFLYIRDPGLKTIRVLLFVLVPTKPRPWLIQE